MILELRWHISEYVTGLLVIVAAVVASIVAQRREEAELTELDREAAVVG